MEMQDLINQVNSFGVKVVYDEAAQAAERTMRGVDIIYFTPVDGEEREKYQRMHNKDEFTSTSACIHFPNIHISDVIDTYKNCDGSGIYKYTCDLIQSKCDIDENMDKAFIIFMFLHEVGHWKQFESLKCNVKSFVEMDMELYKSISDKMCDLEKQRFERIGKGSSCEQTAKEKEKRLAAQYMEKYRNIPKEKDADEFALREINDVLKKLNIIKKK